MDTQKRLEKIFEYHQQTKHLPQRYAKGPGYLEWSSQPNPFRRYEGASLLPLNKDVPDGPQYDDAFVPGRIPPEPVSLESISQLFYNCLAISAWKVDGPSRWALRVNPSSGNLHPTEGYLLCGPVKGLCDTPQVSHYAPKGHALEVRAQFTESLWDEFCHKLPQDTIFIALTSIHWREAWKYGQRAYRYCQLDAGHAIAAVSLAAAGLGWQVRVVDSLGTEELSLLLGLSSQQGLELEEPDVLLAIGPELGKEPIMLPEKSILEFKSLPWQGRPNKLSTSQVDWDINSTVAAARKPSGPNAYEPFQSGCLTAEPFGKRSISLRKIIHQRRSAVAMDRLTRMPRKTFYQMLNKITAVQYPPFTTLPWKPHIHLAIFIHRVDDLSPGLYFLVRDPSQKENLKSAFTRIKSWQPAQGCPKHLELYLLEKGDPSQIAKQISCFQDIAMDGCFSLGMIADFSQPLHRYGPSFYPRLYWEAGLIGQILYLEAETVSLRGTGIGCFFDDALHDLLGMKDKAYQDLYHFTVGGAVEDPRLRTLAPYSTD